MQKAEAAAGLSRHRQNYLIISHPDTKKRKIFFIPSRKKKKQNNTEKTLVKVHPLMKKIHYFCNILNHHLHIYTMQKDQTPSEIHRAFEYLKKDELNTLRKMCNYPINSNLNKAELVDALEDSFRKDPVSLLMALPVFDLEILSEICKSGRGYVLVYDKFPDILYSMKFNIVVWDFEDEDHSKLELWLTDDMYMLISPFIDQVLSDVKEGHRHLWDNFFWGMLWLYGITTTDDIISVMKKTFGKEDKDWLPAYIDFQKYIPFENLKHNGEIIHPAISDPEDILQGRLSRNMKYNKEYTIDDILAVGVTGPYFRYGHRTKVYENAVSALKKCGFDEFEAASRLSRMWFEVQNADGQHKPVEIIQRAIGTPELRSIDELNAIIGSLFEYANSLPRWFLGGRIPNEIPLTPQEQSQLAFMTSAMDKASAISGFKGIGRNDRCPCGSGLKYKNCHGKNLN